MTTVPLRHVATVWTSSVDKHTVEGEIPVQLCNYTDAYKKDRVRPGPDLMRATATPAEIQRNRLRIGDSVFTKDSEDPSDIGISAYVDGEADDFVCGYHLAIARPLGGTHPRFLNWALRGRPALDHFGVNAAGISRYGIALADLRAAPVPAVEYENQRRIADFLDDRVSLIDRAIAARYEQRELISAYEAAELQGIFSAASARFGNLRLGHVLNGLEQGWSPQAEAAPANLGQWGVMRSGCVNGGWFRADDNKKLPDGLEPVVAYEIRGGDLLMSRASGSLDLIGSVAVVPGDVREHLLLCDKIYRLTPGPEWSAGFLAPMLRSRENRDRIRLGVSGAEGMANNLPAGVVRDLRVPAVPRRGQIEVIEQTNTLAKESELTRSRLGRSIDLLTEYKSSLITAAVTGELAVTTAGSNIPG